MGKPTWSSFSLRKNGKKFSRGGGGQEDFDIRKVIFTPAAEGHGLCPWMNAPRLLSGDVAPLGREVGCHGLCPWGSSRDFFTKKRRPWSLFVDFREA